MALLVSVNGQPPVPAHSVVIFEDHLPVALAQPDGGHVYFADAIRDTDFASRARSLGVRPPSSVKEFDIGVTNAH